MTQEVVIIIPARFKSSRFPGKPLANILGKPLILHVVEVCVKVLGKEAVYVATEDNRIKKLVETAGYNVVMTSEFPQTGTDRLAEAAEKIPANIYINVQGDEPMVDPKDIAKIIEAKKIDPERVINGYAKLGQNEDPNSLNIPKVVFTESGQMAYMSRRLLPASKDLTNVPKYYYKQVCIYGFSKKDLIEYARFSRKSQLEAYEDIEILRYLDIGIPVKMVEMSGGSLAVDEPDDIKKVEFEMRRFGR